MIVAYHFYKNKFNTLKLDLTHAKSFQFNPYLHSIIRIFELKKKYAAMRIVYLHVIFEIQSLLSPSVSLYI